MTCKITIALTLMLLTQGCSLFKNGNQRPNLQIIQSRVALVANIALSLEPVQPFRTQLCDTVQVISRRLDQLQNQNMTKIQVTEFVMKIVDQRLDGQVASVARFVLRFVINRVWNKYAILLGSNSVIIVQGITGGLADACDLVVPFSASTVDTSSLEANLRRLLDG